MRYVSSARAPDVRANGALEMLLGFAARSLPRLPMTFVLNHNADGFRRISLFVSLQHDDRDWIPSGTAEHSALIDDPEVFDRLLWARGSYIYVDGRAAQLMCALMPISPRRLVANPSVVAVTNHVVGTGDVSTTIESSSADPVTVTDYPRRARFFPDEEGGQEGLGLLLRGPLAQRPRRGNEDFDYEPTTYLTSYDHIFVGGACVDVQEASEQIHEGDIAITESEKACEAMVLCYRGRDEGTATAAQETALSELVTAAVREIVAKALAMNEDELDNDQPLSELGIDSLKRVELRRSIEESLEVNLPTAVMWKESLTVSVVAQYILAECGEQSEQRFNPPELNPILLPSGGIHQGFCRTVRSRSRQS